MCCEDVLHTRPPLLRRRYFPVIQWSHTAGKPPKKLFTPTTASRMVTDRGPNGQPGGRRTFPVPEFNPTIVHVMVKGDRI